MGRFATCLLVLLCAATTVSALELTLPSSARQTEGIELGLDSYALPVGAYEGGALPTREFEGYVVKQAWRVEGAGITPLQVLQPLRSQLIEAGFQSVYECRDRACGGFDFRFATDMIAPPAMLVNLDDYRFFAALKGKRDAPSDAVSLFVSRSGNTTFVQLIKVSVDGSDALKIDKGEALEGSDQRAKHGAVELPVVEVSLSKQLEETGHVILFDLVFATGSSDLGDGSFETLEKIAAYLKSNPQRRIALVGHTDAVGGLDGNIALSRKRAASVRDRLIAKYGVPQAQLEAEGVGYLAPVASNLTDAGRETNRRVEAVLVSRQ